MKVAIEPEERCASAALAACANQDPTSDTDAVPSTRGVERACCGAPTPRTSRRRSRVPWSALPSVMLAALPRVTCPACWPAYAGALSALGLPVMIDLRWMLPLTVASLVVAVWALVRQARGHRRALAWCAGGAAAMLILAGKFVFDSRTMPYVGAAILVGASLWSAARSARIGTEAVP